jgi:hypothetical protein
MLINAQTEATEIQAIEVSSGGGRRGKEEEGEGRRRKKEEDDSVLSLDVKCMTPDRLQMLINAQTEATEIQAIDV